jgi:hypothetical protein
MTYIGPNRKILFILGYSSSPSYQNVIQNNAVLKDFSAVNPQVYIADWPSIAAAHPEYISGDGTHLSGQDAAQAYSDMIFGVNTRGTPVDCSNQDNQNDGQADEPNSDPDN